MEEEKEIQHKEAHDRIFKKIEELKDLIKDPDNFIHKHFSILRNHIDLERESAKDYIDDHFDTLITSLQNIENDCKLQKELKSYENFELEFESFEERDYIENEVITMEENINESIMSYKTDLLQNQIVSVDPMMKNLQKLLEPIEIKIDNVHRNLKSYTKPGYFNYNLKDFNNFSLIKNSNIFSDTFEVNGMTWYLRFSNEGNGCLDCFLELENCNKLEYKIIYTTTHFSINNINENSKKVCITNQEFNVDERSWGKKGLMTFDEIFNYGFYDEENDTIYATLRLEINDINMILPTE